MKREIFVEQMEKLVAFRTMSQDLNENRAAIEYVQTILPDEARVELVENNGALIMLAGSGRDIYKPEYGYLVHIDVVAGRDDQFELRKDGDSIYGRGVSDMKFSIPIGVSLLRSMIEAKKDFTFVVTTDEEIGGGNGTNRLANNLEFRPKVLIIPDGGDNFELVNRSKGVAHIWIESEGKPAHASRIWEGKNALHPLMKLADQLLEIYEENEHEKNWGTTLNVGIVNGGVSTNQVCPSAIMKLDFRFPESESVEGILNRVIHTAKSIDPSLKVKLAASGDPTYTDPSNRYVRKMLESGQEVLGRRIEVVGVEGASDGRYFAKYNIPTILIKPNGGDIHGDNEWISVTSVLKFYEMLEVYLKSV